MTGLRALVFDATGTLVADHGYTIAPERSGRRHRRAEELVGEEVAEAAVTRRGRRDRRRALAVLNAVAVVGAAAFTPLPH